MDGPAMSAAAVAWQRWCHQDPEIAVVDDLNELPDWTLGASTASKDALLARLHRMAQDDAEAAVVLAWLLLPGVTSLAAKLADLSLEVDALVAGALWIRVRTKPTNRCVAVTVLRDVRQSVLADLGIGEAARRMDPVWSRTTTYDGVTGLPCGESEVVCAESELGFLIQAAVLNGAISSADAGLLIALAETAGDLGAASRRGRAGLTCPAVVDAVTVGWPTAGRTVRRRVGTIVERLRNFAADHHIEEDLHEFFATHDLPPVPVLEFLDLYLWDHIEEYLDEMHRELDESA